MIQRINKIHGHRVFHSFTWPEDLPDFDRFNLIYGWNGAGKTTLSNLFRHLERRTTMIEGTIEFLVDKKVYSGSALAISPELPRIRVFNRDYRDEAIVVSVEQPLKPIFFLGTESVAKQKEIGALRTSRTAAQDALGNQNSARDRTSKALDELCIREGKAIKELLSSSGQNPYNNYDKASFKGSCRRLSKHGETAPLLSKEEKTRLKLKKDELAKDVIGEISFDFARVENLKERVSAVLPQTVTSQVLPDLAGDSELAEWVRRGIAHHTGTNHTHQCRFCTNQLPAERIAALEAHFNDEYGRLLETIDQLETDIHTLQHTMRELPLPDKAALYDHLRVEYVTAATDMRELIDKLVNHLDQLAAALSAKRMKPFQPVDLVPFIVEAPAPTAFEPIEKINELVRTHNTETSNFTKVIEDARKRLEEGLILEALPRFHEQSKALETIEEERSRLQTTIREQSSQIAKLEREVVQHQTPGHELTTELANYLGRDELKFKVVGTGYQITRAGIPALNLSEGERTAIALLYFLKSLQGQKFDVAKDIVVIDDPVSSLDANSLFCAFGYIRARTKDAGQLFILTHNFPLFRQAKNWFNHLNRHKPRPARFYMIEAGFISAKRNAVLRPLDPLLHEYESEYHYLFATVCREAASPPGRRFEEFYPMPNIARRVLESFLAFRYPRQTSRLDQQLSQVNIEEAKKARVLRFLHTYSHDGKISEPEHDLTILSETPSILKDLLEIIKAEDPKHYDEMQALIAG